MLNFSCVLFMRFFEQESYDTIKTDTFEGLHTIKEDIEMKSIMVCLQMSLMHFIENHKEFKFFSLR